MLKSHQKVTGTELSIEFRHSHYIVIYRINYPVGFRPAFIFDSSYSDISVLSTLTDPVGSIFSLARAPTDYKPDLKRYRTDRKPSLVLNNGIFYIIKFS